MTRYTDENIQFIRECASIEGMTQKRLTKLYNERFAHKRTHSSLSTFRSEQGILLNNKKAHACRNHKNVKQKPIGTERVRKGYVEVKVAAPNKWEQKQRHIWQTHHNKQLEHNEVVIFMDQNNRNFAIDNLMKVTRGELGELNKRSGFTNHAELNKASVYTVRLNQTIRRKNK